MFNKKILAILILIGILGVGCSIPPRENPSSFAGHYEYVLDDMVLSSQYIDLEPSEPGEKTHFKIKGHAEWQGVEPSNVHVGDIAGEISINDNRATYTQPEDGCVIRLNFVNNSIQVSELLEPDQKISHCGGANVSFDGRYVKKLLP